MRLSALSLSSCNVSNAICLKRTTSLTVAHEG